MRLVCTRCEYLMLPEQRRCPECGDEGGGALAIPLGSEAELAWHGGCLFAPLGCIGVLLLICLWVLLLTGVSGAFGAVVALSILVAAVVLPVMRRTLSTSGVGATPEGAESQAKAVGSSGQLLILRDVLRCTIGDILPLAAVEAIRLEPTARADRMRLRLTLRPIDAVMPPLQRREWMDTHVGFDDELWLPDTFVIRTGARQAEAIRRLLESRVAEARCARSPLSNADRAAIFPQSDQRTTRIPLRGRRGMLLVDERGFRRREDGPVSLDWGDVQCLDLVSTVDSLHAPKPGRGPQWSWNFMVVRRSRRFLGVEWTPRIARFEFAHDDPRAGIAAWDLITARGAAARSVTRTSSDPASPPPEPEDHRRPDSAA